MSEECRFRYNGFEMVCYEHDPAKAALCTHAADALRARLAEVMVDVREWACEKCNVVYPARPNAVSGSITFPECPRCGAGCFPKSSLIQKRLRAMVVEAERKADHYEAMSENVKSLLATRDARIKELENGLGDKEV